MNQTVLGRSPAAFKQQLDRLVLRCAVLGAAAVGLNILFTACRTEQNHTLMLVLNILTDVLAGIYILYTADVQILPKSRLYRLACRETELLRGTVSSISTDTIRYMNIDCHTVTLDSRRLFLPAGTICLEENKACFCRVAANIILEAEQ